MGFLLRLESRTEVKLWEEKMIHTKVATWSLALFGAVTYLVCIVYGLIVPDSLHMTAFLEQMFPGFRWLTLPGFLIGLVEAFLYGAYVGVVFSPIYNALWKRWGAGADSRASSPRAA